MASVQCPGVVYTMFLWSRVSRRPSCVVELALHLHDITSCDDDVVHIQSGSSSSLSGYGNSFSSNCFLSASFCICFMASTKGVESTSRFSMPPRPIPGKMGEPRDIGVSRLDPRPEPGAWESPTSMDEPGDRPSNNRSSSLVTG